MIESQFCSMTDEKDFGFEETKSTILDYFILFKEARSTGGAIVIFFVLEILLYVFMMNQLLDGTLTQHSKITIMLMVNFLALLGFISILVISFKLIYTSILKGKKLGKELLEIQNNLIRKSYLINFELVEPEIIIQGGDPKLEKFVNHLSLVFTDINKKNEKRLKRGKTVEQFWIWKRRRIGAWKNYYFAISTVLGVYVVQSYENKVTVEDVKTVIKKIHLEKAVARLGFGEGVSYRFIILGKEFDDSFSNDNILTTMNELKRRFRMDVILETEYGYSTIWVD